MLNVSEGQFVINPTDPSAAINHVTQTLWQRNMQNQRLNLMKEGRENQVSNYLEQETDPSHHYTGSVYDPIVTQNLQQARSIGTNLALKGAGVTEIRQAIGPLLDKVNNYSMTAKAVNAQIDNQVKLMRDNKLDVGYKLGDAVMGARQSALMKKDADGNLVPKDPSEVNLSSNFLSDEISAHPDQYTTNEALQNYAQHSGKSTRQDEVLATQPNGNSVKKSVEVVGANWEQPDADKTGKIQMVPMYDHATDNGQILHHTVVGPDGKESEEPIRLFNEQHFDQMMQNPGVADYIKGQVIRHIGEYKDPSGKPVTLASPTAKLIARGIAYKELADAGNSTVKTVSENKVSAPEVNVHVYGNKEQQAYDSSMGHFEAKSDAGEQGLLPATKENAVQALGKVFNNDPDYMSGPTAKVGNQNVIDITSRMPKGGLQYTNQFGKKTPFQAVYFDPAKREVIVKKPGGYEHYNEAQAGQFMAGIAEANGVPIAAVKPALTAAGWSGGKFGAAAPSPDVSARASAQFAAAHQAKVQTGMQKLDTASDDTAATAAIKGIEVPGGKIDAVSMRGGIRTTLGADKYAVDVKSTDGKTSTLTFKDKAALQTYLSQGAPQTKKTTDDLGKQYGF